MHLSLFRALRAEMYAIAHLLVCLDICTRYKRIVIEWLPYLALRTQLLLAFVLLAFVADMMLVPDTLVIMTPCLDKLIVAA